MKDYKDIVANLNLDLILVLGWYYIVPKEIRDLAKMGAWGSMLLCCLSTQGDPLWYGL